MRKFSVFALLALLLLAFGAACTPEEGDLSASQPDFVVYRNPT